MRHQPIEAEHLIRQARHGPMAPFGRDIDVAPWHPTLAVSCAVAGQIRSTPAPSVRILVRVERVEIGFIIWLILFIPDRRRGLAIVENRVVHRAIAFGTAMSAGPLPDNLITEILWPKHHIHEHLEVMARG